MLSVAIFAISGPKPAKRPSLSNSSLPQNHSSASVGKLQLCRHKAASVRSGQWSVEISFDDVILQHAAERKRKTTRRPGKAFGDGKVCRKDKDGAESECHNTLTKDMGAAVCVSRSISHSSAAADHERYQHREHVALWVAAATTISTINPMFSTRVSVSLRISSR